MKRRLIAAALVLTVGAGAFAFGWRDDTAPLPLRFLGYVEAETLLVGAKGGGRLVALNTVQGAVVAAGGPLFALDSKTELERQIEATAEVERARARYADLLASQRRPEEVAVLRAVRRQIVAGLSLARSEFERQQTLSARGVAADARLEHAATDFAARQADLARIEHEIDAAQLPARAEQIGAAKADLAAAEARRQQAQVALDDRRVSAPQDGQVLDVLHRVGEVVLAGQPVVEILPPENVHVRFYVPQSAVAGLAIGRRVVVSCDGCPTVTAARIIFIAPEAEFTPPVIFSREERARLVFLVKAEPLRTDTALKPGLPVAVTLADDGSAS